MFNTEITAVSVTAIVITRSGLQGCPIELSTLAEVAWTCSGQ